MTMKAGREIHNPRAQGARQRTLRTLGSAGAVHLPPLNRPFLPGPFVPAPFGACGTTFPPLKRGDNKGVNPLNRPSLPGPCGPAPFGACGTTFPPLKRGDNKGGTL